MIAITSSSLAALLLLAPVASSVSVAENFLETLRTPRPFHAQPSPNRNRTCVAESYNDLKTDDADNIIQAIQDCNNGGHVIFAEKQTYTIASPLNLTGLTSVDIDIQGTLSFPAHNLTYWQANSFDLQYQNATSFFILGGSDINVYGSGTVQGNGQAWWDEYVNNKKLKRPVLFAIVGLEGGSVSGIKLRNSPFWHNIIANSSDVVYSGLDLFSTSNNGNFEKNTDGWDIYRSERITIENSTITNGDGISPPTHSIPSYSNSPLWTILTPNRLRLLQTQLNLHPGPKPALQRHTRHLSRQPRPIPVAHRLRRGYPRAQHQHVQLIRRCSHQSMARRLL
jgi:galacturan 1,4-alpha-galacturonidase